MRKLMEIVVYTLATIGLAFVIKHIRVMHCKEGCCLCGWHKPKVEGFKSKVEKVKSKGGEVKSKVEEVKSKVEEFKKKEEVKSKVEEVKSKVEGFKTKVHGEKRIGSRYGSNPVKY